MVSLVTQALVCSTSEFESPDNPDPGVVGEERYALTIQKKGTEKSSALLNY